MAKPNLKCEAIELRKQGFSYSDIKGRLSVSKSTLSIWLKEVAYKPNRIVLNRLDRARDESSKVRTKIRLESEKESLLCAQTDIGKKMTRRDLLFLGLGLYLGEGSKTSMVRVVNSDVEVIRLAMSWLKKAYGLRNQNFSIRIHLYPDSDVKKALDYWARSTGLSISQFQKTSIDRRTNKRKSHEGKLPFGTAHLTVKSCGEKKLGVFLRRRILSSIEIVESKAGMV